MGEVQRFRRLKQQPPPWWRHDEGWRRYRASAFRDARQHRMPAWRRGLGLAAFAFFVVAVAGSSLTGGSIHAFVGAVATPRDAEEARFGRCIDAGAASCIIDGDTFRYEGRTIRIADIDTPEVHDYACVTEKQRGEAATRRLVSLLNAGPFTLAPYERNTDQYGRLLRIVTRDGKSLGRVLVEEGHARSWDGARRPWC
jgi:micrococcal nuclease